MRILFVDFSTKLKTVWDLANNARGGMVSSLFAVSDYLSERGHTVHVVSDVETPGRTRSGVEWLKEPDSSYDVLVCNRGVGQGYSAIEARRRVLWTHDLPHVGFIMKPKIMNAFHRVVFMSRYAERVWRAFFPEIGKSVTIPNGVDKAIFHPREKVPDTLIYASAPNRGLKRLPFIVDATSAKIGRDLKLKAFSNMAALHPNEVRDEKQDGFALIYEEIRESKVKLCDPVPQPALAKQLGMAEVMVIPTDYPEICSNTILQSLACGTPVVTTGRLGSAPEWIKDGKNGCLTKWQPADYMVYQMEIINRLIELFKEPRKLVRMQRAAARTKIYSWSEIGAQWDRMLRRL